MAEGFNFIVQEARGVEEALITEIVCSIDNYKRSLESVMKSEFKGYEQKLKKDDYSENEIRLLMDRQARLFEFFFGRADDLKEFVKQFINENVIAIGQEALFRSIDSIIKEVA